MNNILSTLAEMSNVTVSTDGGSSAGAGAALFVIVLFGVLGLVSVILLVFWVMSLVHLIQHEDIKDRTLWLILLFLVGGIIGPIYHFAVRKPYEKQSKSSSPNTNS